MAEPGNGPSGGRNDGSSNQPWEGGSLERGAIGADNPALGGDTRTLRERMVAVEEVSLLTRDSQALRTFTLAEGVLMLVLGALALVFPVLASMWVTAVVAIGFLVGGIVGWVSTLARARRLSGAVTFWRFTVATLFLVAGGWMVRQLAAGPLTAARQVAALALAIGVVFLVEGLVASWVALSHRQVRGWGWGLVNGVVTLVLGLLILTMKSLSLLWVLGTLVGISFLFSGLDLLTFSASFHPVRATGEARSQRESKGAAHSD